MVSVTNKQTGNRIAPPEDELNQVVAGHYSVDLDHLLGQGGMALVYFGRDLRTRREVALKTLRLEYRHDPETRARFRREARTMAFLKHPNVARVYDLYEDADGPWAVLEYVPGRSLKEIVQEAGPLDPGWTSAVLDQVASALAHLHSHGLVHLDVKPQNLLMSEDGTVKLIDFGLAQPAGAIQESISGSTFGTAAYLAPEQASGEPVDVTTDVYALGCVVYELLTGRPPFEPTGQKELKNEIIRAHLDQMPTAPTLARPDLRLPAWIDDTVLWALAKRPEDRYHDVQTFAQMFRSGLEQTGPIVTGRNGLLTTEIIDTVPVWTPEPLVQPRPSVSRRAAGGLYRAGGRVARRSTRFRRAMWRLVGAVAAANLMLAALVWYDQGELPGLGSAGHLEPGTTANVVTDGLNVRSGPGLDAPILAIVSEGDEVVITGDSTTIASEDWWPVQIVLNGQSINGHVWEKGIKGDRSGLSGAIQSQLDQLKEIPSNALDGAGL
jgi:tRNA A-37 threonylcarbamoyl transferase component Bud32